VRPPEALAAVDCGTNSTRLLVTDGAGAALVREMRITRLGQGVDATHALAPAAMERTLDVLRSYRATMDAQGVVRARLVATSAVRDASNGEEFLGAAAAIMGFDAELLAGEEEGRLAYRGATTGLDPSAGDDVVVDIGGGSTELITAPDGSARAVSMEVGCVRLTERHLRHDPPQETEIALAVDVVRSELDRACRLVPELVERRPGGRLVGLAGTVSTLAALELGLDHYDRARVHHATLTRRTVGRWCDDLGGETVARRAARVGMLDGRQDVIFGGALVLREVMDRLGFDACLVSESDILDGLVASLAGDHPSLPG
jgi:exopolyphosphatase / guanosine-5'-triphosphate,3'-diphosphate pyrophosphatase